jgi:hypothetical protein
MKRITVKHIGIMSFANLIGTWNAILGVFLGVAIAISGSITVVNTADYGVLAEVLLVIGVIIGSIVLVPLFAYVTGWLYGAVIALVANLVVTTSGGVELDIEESKL